MRFNGEGVSLLADQGLVRLAYRELAEVVLPPLDAWDAYYRQLAVIDRACEADIVRLETVQGMVFTASGPRVTAFRKEGEAAASMCLVEPAWSRTPVPVAWSAVRTVWRAPAHVVPLSRFVPQEVVQPAALGSSWTWRADRNVADGELRSGGLRYLWGFGVHAPNTLVFRLPETARAFHSNLGIDASVGAAGCVVGRVFLDELTGTPLYQSHVLRGSAATITTGEIKVLRGNAPGRLLYMVVDGSGEARGQDVDPLDIGDHADWLEPALLLDVTKLRAIVAGQK